MSDLKTTYKYIEFIDATHLGHGWACVNRKARSIALGGCAYYKPWKQWVFSAEIDSVFSEDCLADIRDFLLQLNRRGAPTNSRAAAGGRND